MRRLCPSVMRLAIGFGLTWLSSALPMQEPAAPPDKFTEALMYEGFARDAFRCDGGAIDDPVAAAVKWTNQAIAAILTFSTPDASREARARGFLTRQRAELAALVEWDKYLKSSPKKIESLLATGRLSAAEALLPAGDAPECDARLRRARLLTAAKRREYDALVTEGDRLCSAQPASAVDRYRSALRLDRDNKTLKEKIRGLCRSN